MTIFFLLIESLIFYSLNGYLNVPTCWLLENTELHFQVSFTAGPAKGMGIKVIVV